jgi:hypothetical protein
MHRLTLVLLVALIAAPGTATGQTEDLFLDEMPALVGPQSLYIIDSPTAAVLGHGIYRISGRILDDGAVVISTKIGIRDRFMVGVAWGMENMLGRGEIDFNDNTGVSIRLILVEEAELPAIAIGFEDQGYGPWDEDLRRYERKSKGFYVTGTRNWYGPLSSDVATTAGINYTTETHDDSSLDFFFGLEQDFGNEFALVAEYALGLNDRDQVGYGQKKGWLDMGFRWNIQEQIQFKFFFRDLLGNFGENGSVDRHLLVSYESTF